MPELKTSGRKPVSPWQEYWERDEFWSGSKIWEINNRIFFESLKNLLKLRPDEEILDIGCGAGHLEVLLAPNAASVLAVDTSEKFVEMTRRRSQSWPNVSAEKLPENYTSLSGFGKFSLILCHSVVQYYKDSAEVLDLIASACGAAKPGARILIADLPLKRHFLGKCRDVFCSFLGALKGGYAFELLKMGVKANAGSGYAVFSKTKPSLEFSWREIESFAAYSGAKTTIIRSSLSIYANRPSLLIEL